MIIIKRRDTVTRFQFLKEAVCSSHSVDTLRRKV